MGPRLGTLILFLVVLAVGALLGSALTQWVGEEESEASVEVPGAPEGVRVRVEVLNAGGRAGMARLATTALRDRGFDVVYFGNAETFGPDSSVVLDRVGRLEWARRVGEALRIRRVLEAPDTNRYVDVTVRLGPEWEPEPTEPGAPEGRSPASPSSGLSGLWSRIRDFVTRADSGA